ncbi:YcjF family protein [Rhodomicrobium sp. Az07]|uniref:YcjF family protein n=1 Tax=Rhodomicrobium sp. Az07 TaxID=2839034 RepID=UPI001BEB4EB7|nr:DUF697 domain-containing protein [Rhodomicrobium sp. Az07]MBT3070483.1 YcjF family protein [Rhodomicrobium sp. Az07]
MSDHQFSRDLQKGLENLRDKMDSIEETKAVIKELEPKAEAIIWANTIVNAGLGVAPVGINILTFIAANTTMIISLGHIYGYTLSREQAGSLIKQIFMAAGMVWAMGVLGMKLFLEIVKVAGIATAGTATAVGMALDGVLCGGLSYALGYTSKMYFVKDCKLTTKEMSAEFKIRFEEGRRKAREAASSKR